MSHHKKPNKQGQHSESNALHDIATAIREHAIANQTESPQTLKRRDNKHLWIQGAGVFIAAVYAGLTYGLWSDARMTRQLDQRPWVFPSDFVLNGEPYITGNKVSVRMGIGNTGKTPGIHTVIKSRLQMALAEPVIDWDAISLRDHDSPLVIFPNVNNLSHQTRDVLISADQLTSYGSKTALKIYFQVQISYDDVLGFKHWTKACLFHTYGRDLNGWDTCPSGITTDDTSN